MGMGGLGLWVGAVGWGCGLGLWVGAVGVGQRKERRWGWGRRWEREGKEVGKGREGMGREGGRGKGVYKNWWVG